MCNFNLQRLEQKLGYTFKNKDLPRQACTHRSVVGKPHYESLEFLGDSMIGFVVSQLLYTMHPNKEPGVYSRMKASLVSCRPLAAKLRSLGLHTNVMFGPGFTKAQGTRLDSIHEDVMEALIGAVVVDGGHEEAIRVVTALFTDDVKHCPSHKNACKDSKTILQEYMQAKHYPLPVYEVISIEGEEHKQTFTVSATACGITKEATGHKRRIAEQEAAKLLLEHLKHQPHR